jgi:archaeal flagellar protein FlaJ
MNKIETKTKKLITVGSTIAAVAILIVGYLVEGTAALNDFLVFALIAVLAPLSAIDIINQRWQKGIDQHLPELFTSIVQAQEVGMTLPQALDDAAKRDHGPLTPELKRMTVQMSWGYSFEDALIGFGKRIGTNLVQRILPMIVEASRSGGKVERVFEPMGSFIQTNNMMQKERKGETRPYIIIIYVALFVFLFTIVLLFKTFFDAAGGTPLMATDGSSPQDMQQIFMHMTIIQGFFGGLAAGKMGEGSMQAGLKHSLVMIVLGYLALKLFM